MTTATAPRDFVAEALFSPIADIGQIDAASRRALGQAIRRGDLVKWQGHWFPMAGAPWGLGPAKTCYGTPEARADRLALPA